MPQMAHKPKFVIDSSEAQSLATEANLTILNLLPTLVKPAQPLARPPISNFAVAALGLGSSGRIFIGVNLEFPGLPLHHSVHAEQFLLINLAYNSETCLQAIAVSAAPCGHCRQFLQEIRNAPNLQILIKNQSDGEKFQSLDQLLPDRFGPFDLLDTNTTPLLLDPNHNNLTLIADDDNDHVSNGFGKVGHRKDLILEALEAANRSHALYSNCPSGVALVDDQGRVYRGSYMESAAYNPSLGPVQAAVVAYVAAGGSGYERIVGGALVEMEGADVSQEATARMILLAISPKCELVVAHCKQSAA